MNKTNVYGSVAAVGVDVHYKFSKVSMRDGQGRLVRRERLDHTDRQRLRRRLAAWPKAVPVVLEASFGWGWLAEEMQAAGLQVELSNCFKLEKMRKARGLPKTNDKDASLLSELPLEKTDWWRVWLAPAGVRNQREWLRLRMDLVRLQTGTKNRISAIFHRHGIFHAFSDLFGAAGRAFLAELCREGRHAGGQLPEGALAALRSQLRLLGHVRSQLAAVNRQIRGRLAKSDLARRLDGIPGLGEVLVHTLMGEIGRIDRFRSDRALASYSLLAPISQDTGEPSGGGAPLGRHLGVRGNRTLKWAFIEAAHGAVRRGGRWRAMFDRYTDGGKRNRNRGYIKVARALVRLVYVVWQKGVEYSDSPPPRRSPKQRMQSWMSRPGTGQPCRPMAAVQ
jgi:transposase